MAIGGYAMPTLQDEKATYGSWGWTWSVGQEPSFASDPTFSVTNPDIHGGTEGDDLWTYLQMYRRTAQGGYLDRANAWATFFKNPTLYRNSTTSSDHPETYGYDYTVFASDHQYGWGLMLKNEYDGDSAALTELLAIAAKVKPIWEAGSAFSCPLDGACSYYGLRFVGRHLLFFTRLYELTADSQWATVRDTIIAQLLASPYWDNTLGCWFPPGQILDSLLVGSYAAADNEFNNLGTRITAAFHLGILAEAMFHAIRTGAASAATLKTRLVQMAYFVKNHGLDPTYQYTGNYFGRYRGADWFNYNSGGPVTFWDPNYTTALVNLQVFGYRYTGDSTLLTSAKNFFNRGTKGVYGSPTARQAGDSAVGHFVDTEFDSSVGNAVLAHNKGELQYTWLIFENGGFPTTEAASTTYSMVRL